ncbi:MAG: tRNA uridine-5-carboxymethylaminomethyl(34) synthesis enzyme MnmG, partial [Gammaproteobacteria bacterium]|nr:tRNA uridine-5-carboxymethylaminomethyl(34) synthesis enzyme MnmG [Gammaproteobacteria bacterium]
MFTSRAEYRLQLREDNADLRLTETAHELGLVDQHRRRELEHKRRAIETERRRLRDTRVGPHSVDADLACEVLGQPLQRDTSLLDLLCRPQVGYDQVMRLSGGAHRLSDRQAIRQIEIEARYSGYIERQSADIARREKHRRMKLPADTDYRSVRGLSAEARQKLAEVRPQTLDQAARIPGITPAAVSLLMVHLKKRRAA